MEKTPVHPPTPVDLPNPAAQDVTTTVPLKIEDWATAIIMALLACITFANVLVRYFTDSSFAWTEEFSVFLMIALVMVAASAAVARDRHMHLLDARYPGYGFARHKGYCVPEHLAALQRLGPCVEHRRSFAPVWLRLHQGELFGATDLTS